MEEQAMIEGLDADVVDRMTSRRDALRRGGRMSTALALGSVPVVMAAMAKTAFAQSLPQSVVDVLNFALTLEYLENEFYKSGLAAAGLIPSADRSIFQTIQAHEQAHVDFLRGQLGSQAVAKPTFDFTAGGTFNPFGDYAQFKL